MQTTTNEETPSLEQNETQETNFENQSETASQLQEHEVVLPLAVEPMIIENEIPIESIINDYEVTEEIQSNDIRVEESVAVTDSQNTPNDSQDADTIVHESVPEDSASSTDATPAVTSESHAVDESTEDEHESSESVEKTRSQVLPEELLTELKGLLEHQTPFEAEVTSRVRGGLRLSYKEAQMFLPASHFSFKRKINDKELLNTVGTHLSVLIHEIQEESTGRVTIITSRRKLAEDDFWNKINVGDIVEGVVSSVATFGVFVDIGGVEGLIHISRLSQVHVDDPKKAFKRGQRLQSVIVEINRERKRIALSRKELEKSPWHNVASELPPGSRVKGKVRRLTEFGAYIELKPGIDGLLRTNELSWALRLRAPSELLQVDQDIEVEILSVSEEKQAIALSYKRILPNPWEELKDKYPVSTVLKGRIVQIIPQGVIVRLGEEVDGFMPRSKIKNAVRGKKIPYKNGDEIDVQIIDLIPKDESLIISPFGEEEKPQPRERTERKHDSGNKDNQHGAQSGQGSFSLSDMLSEQQKEDLFSVS
ncbi:MAG: hypothetical protein HW421_146 [Ignavibacteria bacterium]|nr:hypothetical protein [Ignavibacteria bacterium]